MKIEIVGTGNVGSHLATAFEGKGDINLVPARTLDGLRSDADLCILCVKDEAVGEVARQVAARVSESCVIAHTSGSVGLEAIRDCHSQTGVFYPFQTFTKGNPLDYSRIPFLIEGSDETAEKLLVQAARLVSGNVVHADSEARGNLHVAGVFACNFVNHLWRLSNEYLDEKGLPFQLLMPLIEETMRKMERLSPAKAQTGPAARKDMETIKKHVERLDGHPDMIEIYRIITNSILER